jgi:DmsE family decaheme c-type cytochrome
MSWFAKGEKSVHHLTMLASGYARGVQKVVVLSKWRFGILAIFVMFFSWQASGETANGSAQKAETDNVSSLSKHTRGKKCVACHKDMESSTPSILTHHAQSCESCHVDSSEGIVTLAKAGEAIRLPKVAECTSCHKKDRKLMHWAFSAHNKAGGSCSDCHTIHASPVSKGVRLSAEKTGKNSTVCISCHQDTDAQFKMRSHHPVREGGMSCIGCHDPHGGSQTVLKSKSEQCLGCHQSIRGPKVFEHAPVVEDCTSCHAPHGSANRGLLNTSEPSVCLQCHSIATSKHGYGNSPTPPAKASQRTVSGTVLRGCTNCHGAIHGSQQDPLLRY